MREFAVEFVEDDEPGLEGRSWALVLAGEWERGEVVDAEDAEVLGDDAEGCVIAAVKRSAVSPEVLTDAWVAFRRMDGETSARPLSRAS